MTGSVTSDQKWKGESSTKLTYVRIYIYQKKQNEAYLSSVQDA